MTTLRRLTALVGIVALGTVGTLLILESSEVIGGRWRGEFAESLNDIAFPSWGLWASALLGVALAIVGIAMVAAQIAPPKKGLNSMHEVYKGRDGETRLRGRAAIGAVRYELAAIDGVVNVDARVANKRMTVELEIDDRANIADIENEARTRLGHEFWINLGLADFALNLLVAHHPKPPRVR